MESNMKRIIAILLTLSMILSLAACGSSKDSGKNTDDTQGKKEENVGGPATTDIKIVDKPQSSNNNQNSDPASDSVMTQLVGKWNDGEWKYQLSLYPDGTYICYLDSPDGNGVVSEEGVYTCEESTVSFWAYGDSGSAIPTFVYHPVPDTLSGNDGTELYRAGEIDDPSDDPYYDPSDDPVNEPIGDPGESPETIGYFNYYGIYPNVEPGSRTSFPNGGCYVSDNTDGYYITSPDVEVKIAEYSPDDGYGYGHMKVNLSVFFKNDLPAEFGQSTVNDYWYLYDTFSGDVISPDASVDSPDNTWAYEFIAARPNGSYDVKVTQAFSYESKKNGYLISFHNTLTIIFPTGYSGVDLVLFPAPKNKKAYKSNKKQDRTIKLMDRKYTTLEGAFIYGLF